MNEFEQMDEKDRTIASLQAEIDRLKGATKVCSSTELSADEKKDESSTKQITEAGPHEQPGHRSKDHATHYQRHDEDQRHDEERRHEEERRRREEDREDRRYQRELDRERKQERVREDKEKVHQVVQSALTGVMNLFQKGKDDGEKKSGACTA